MLLCAGQVSLSLSLCSLLSFDWSNELSLLWRPCPLESADREEGSSECVCACEGCRV